MKLCYGCVLSLRDEDVSVVFIGIVQRVLVTLVWHLLQRVAKPRQYTRP